MRTVGVDVSRDPATTAVCTIRWQSDSALVESVQLPAKDVDVVRAASGPEVAALALDAPFGWPCAMVSAVSSWRPGGRWTAPTDPAAFRLRRTDLFTTDRTADALGVPFASDGALRVVEAYPAAALAMWGVSRVGYKDTDALSAIAKREEMLSVIEGEGSQRWLSWSDRTREQCKETDHALDALVCALVARAAMLGLVEAVPNDGIAAARAEGWIALPRVGSL